MLAVSIEVKERGRISGQPWRFGWVYDESLNISQNDRQDKQRMIRGRDVVWVVWEG